MNLKPNEFIKIYLTNRNEVCYEVVEYPSPAFRKKSAYYLSELTAEKTQSKSQSFQLWIINNILGLIVKNFD